MKFSTELPYSRQVEEEADMVGLMFAARVNEECSRKYSFISLIYSQACYDVRESVSFWQQLHDADQNPSPEYLSTHPSHLSRVESLRKLLPWALDLRTQCKCAPLPAITKPPVSTPEKQ